MSADEPQLGAFLDPPTASEHPPDTTLTCSWSHQHVLPHSPAHSTHPTPGKYQLTFDHSEHSDSRSHSNLAPQYTDTDSRAGVGISNRRPQPLIYYGNPSARESWIGSVTGHSLILDDNNKMISKLGHYIRLPLGISVVVTTTNRWNPDQRVCNR